MHAWLWPLIGPAAIAALWLLHRLGLWLEAKDWLYYRRKRSGGSSLGAWVALQRFIEPGVRHVIEVRQERPVEDAEAFRERLAANLLACLDAPPGGLEEIRLYLTLARERGLDWRQLYQEVVDIQQKARPERAGQIPPPGDVAPPD